jgi:hypothetical protein
MPDTVFEIKPEGGFKLDSKQSGLRRFEKYYCLLTNGGLIGVSLFSVAAVEVVAGVAHS